MKIAAEIKIKHGRLYELCRDAGGVKEFAKQIGVGIQTMYCWLKMKRCPTPGKYTRWYTRDIELALEGAANCAIVDLFPLELRESIAFFRKQPTKHISIKEIEPSQLMIMAGQLEERNLLPSPEDIAIDSEKRDVIKKVLQKLPWRESEVIKLRYGLGDAGYSHTYEEIGQVFQITRERVRQIESKAMRKLQLELIKSLTKFDDVELPPDWETIDKQIIKSQTMTLKERYGCQSVD